MAYDGLTSHQRDVLSASSFFSFRGEGGWKAPLGCVALFSFIGFVLGCVATQKVGHDLNGAKNLKSAPPHQCAYGDITYGSEILKVLNSNCFGFDTLVNPSHQPTPRTPDTHTQPFPGGPWYQIIGLHGAQLNWMEVCAQSCLY
jgi:hypothetical protein